MIEMDGHSQPFCWIRLVAKGDHSERRMWMVVDGLAPGKQVMTLLEGCLCPLRTKVPRDQHHEGQEGRESSFHHHHERADGGWCQGPCHAHVMTGGSLSLPRTTPPTPAPALRSPPASGSTPSCTDTPAQVPQSSNQNSWSPARLGCTQAPNWTRPGLRPRMSRA